MTEQNNTEKYIVLFIGEIRNGISGQRLKDRLSKTFNVSILRIEKLFTGRPVVIKNGLSEPVARKYCDTLKSLGAVSWIEPMPPFYRKYVDRRKNSRTRRNSNATYDRRSGARTRMGTDRRLKSGRRYHDC